MKELTDELNDQHLWVEKWRPTTLDDLILDDPIRDRFKAYADKGELPHLLLHGIQGVGKTTLAKALVNDLNMDMLFVNASLEGDINYHAHRALQELSYDTLKSCKAIEITLPPSLIMILPNDYI